MTLYKSYFNVLCMDLLANFSGLHDMIKIKYKAINVFRIFNQ